MSVNACLAPVCAMHGLAVTTVEGVGSTKTKLHAVQVVLSSAVTDEECMSSGLIC